MTTRTRNRSSGPSSTGPTSPTSSAASRMLVPTALASSLGITTTTDIQASDCTLPPTFITAGPKRSENDGAWSSSMPTPSTPNASFARSRRHRPFRRSRGSTNRRRRLPTHQIHEQSVSQRLTRTEGTESVEQSTDERRRPPRNPSAENKAHRTGRNEEPQTHEDVPR